MLVVCTSGEPKVDMLLHSFKLRCVRTSGEPRSKRRPANELFEPAEVFRAGERRPKGIDGTHTIHGHTYTVH